MPNNVQPEWPEFGGTSAEGDVVTIFAGREDTGITLNILKMGLAMVQDKIVNHYPSASRKIKITVEFEFDHL